MLIPWCSPEAGLIKDKQLCLHLKSLLICAYLDSFFPDKNFYIAACLAMPIKI
jgi:hypothetical protein